MSIECEVKKYSDIIGLECIGRIIDSDAKKFAGKMETLYKKKESKSILDISNVNFIDSHGLGIIVYYNTIMNKENRQLIILNNNPDPHAYVTRLFEITNLHKVLKIVSSMDGIA
jgi:anti-anti-sigma factor